jgi:hypothetical protein
MNSYEYTDASYDRVYEKAECLPASKTGKVNDIVGEWKLVLEINRNDTIDRSCEDIVYHFGMDGMLTVSSSTEVCEFEYVDYPFCPSCYPPKNVQPNLRMGDARVFCEVLLTKVIVYPQTVLTGIGVKFPGPDIKTLFSRIK